ncbi:polyamine ABC transporter permease [Nocardioides aromaticivorans]|uniref:Polyamine ABC transporter permease n=1 Tax=Nocardioides aromaticivorans TaxID=200618 RepID=A0ABX7PGJ2_9ACTN|nr:ABC transporter permease [Nocardioides aromaticivorans]QSR24848.1 polyamine ABC transporter permease [Nocardioides aromaticivorans]
MHEPRRLLLKLFCLLVGIVLVAPTLVVVPIAFTSSRTFQFPPPGWSTQWFAELFSDPAWMDSFLLSLRVAGVVVVLATALGTAAAFALARGKGPWRPIVNGFILAPMIVPGVIIAIAIYYIFLRWHLTSTFTGFVLAHTILAIPPVVISVTASLESLDRRLERAAASLGAGPVVTFFQVTLPLIMPGMLTGALFAFLMSFDEAIISLFLAGPFSKTLPVQLYQSVTSSLTPTIAAASTLIIALSTTLLLICALFASRRTNNV